MNAVPENRHQDIPLPTDLKSFSFGPPPGAMPPQGLIRAELPEHRISGSPEKAGEQYGEMLREEIIAFHRSEIAQAPAVREYASRCWPYIVDQAPASADFIRGMSRGTGLAIADLTALLLHEEFVHVEVPREESPQQLGHCTAVFAHPSRMTDRSCYLGQTWDWDAKRFNFPGVLRSDQEGSPAVLTYHYPGLWSCCGVNSEGLSMVWTGGGYWPLVPPQAGLPTYVVCAELLRLRTAEEAKNFLLDDKKVFAGCFMFLLADPSGKAFVVEGIPRLRIARPIEHFDHRTNLFALPEMMQESGQVTDTSALHSSKRTLTIERLKTHLSSTITREEFRSIFTSWDVYSYDPQYLTVDSIVADSTRRELSIRRGGDLPQTEWKSYQL